MIWKRLFERTASEPRVVYPLSAKGNCRAVALDLTELEDRILMSATPLAPDMLVDADGMNADADDSGFDAPLAEEGPPTALLYEHPGGDNSHLEPQTEYADEVAQLLHDELPADRHELIFVDDSINGYDSLLEQISDSHDSDTQLDIVTLDSSRDGIEQISEVLDNYAQLDAVHILSHGNDNAVQLGNVWLNADHIAGYAADISRWNHAFAVDGDFLIYGCNLADSAEGRELLAGLQILTNTDVAASTDVTGHVDLGGDWDLEFALGEIETEVVLSQASRQLWTFVLPSENVYDGFESHDYSGNSGSNSWANPWQEIGDDNDASAGNVRIAHYDLDEVGTHSLEIQAAENVGIVREVDLSAASSATLSFDFQRHPVDLFLNSTLEILVSDDGGTSWTTLDSIDAGGGEPAETLQLDLTPFTTTHAQIQFLSTGTGSGSIFLDHIDITYDVNVAPTWQPGETLALKAIQEDSLIHSGNSVEEIVNGAGGDRIIDSNTNAKEGIAVVRTDDTLGTWQYDTAADGNWQIFSSVSDTNAVLLGTTSRIRFVPNADFNGTSGQIEFRAWDQTDGQVGDTDVDVSVNGDAQPFSVDTETAHVNVTAVNDAPTLTLPVGQSVAEDTVLSLPAITVSDVDAAGDPLEVTLSAANGTLSLGDTTNLTFSVGDGSENATMTFRGSATDLNNALANLTYQGSLHYNGPDTININVDDLGNNGQGNTLQDSGTIAVNVTAVNDAPTLTLPIGQSVAEDTVLSLPAITVSDVDAAGDPLEVTLSAANGTLSLGDTTNLTFSVGDGSENATMTFRGSATDLNNALANLTYQGSLHYNGPDTININVDDLGNNGQGNTLQDSGTIAVNVTAVNDAPTLTLPVGQSVAEDTVLSLPAITVSDVDAAGDPLEVTLSAANGTLSLGDTTNLTFSVGDGSENATMTFRGSATDLNNALANLTYQGSLHYNGPDTININVDDLGNNGQGNTLQDSGTIAVNVTAVNDAPTLTLPVGQSVAEDTVLSLPAITVSDVDAAGDPLEVTLSAANGTLSLGDTTNLTFSVGNGSENATMTFRGSATDLNNALANLTYQGSLHYNGPDTININVDDLGNNGQGNTLQDSGTIAVNVTAVNNAPTLTLPVGQSVAEDTVLSLPAITVSDVDAAGDPLEVTLSAANGTLSLGDTTNLTFSVGNGSENATMTFRGSATDLNNALANLTYQGSLHYNGPDTININVDDLGNNGQGNTLQDSGTIAVNVTAVNDAPTLTLPVGQSVAEDTVLSLPAITVSDVDAAGDPLEVTLGAANGTLSLGDTTNLTFSVGNGSENATMTFRGSATDLNNALANLTYQGSLHYNGPDTININVDDLGNNGQGNTLQDSGTIAVNVTAVNNAPTLTLPVGQSVAEDTVLSLPAITVSDVDAAGDPLEVTLSAANGTLSLGDTTNLTFSVGNGSENATMTFRGSATDLNNALANLTYQGSLHYNGPDTININVDDLGNNGQGNTLQDSGTIAVNVTAVNDAPTLTLPVGQSVAEDTVLSLPAITVSDVDAAGDPLEVTLSPPTARFRSATPPTSPSRWATVARTPP